MKYLIAFAIVVLIAVGCQMEKSSTPSVDNPQLDYRHLPDKAKSPTLKEGEIDSKDGRMVMYINYNVLLRYNSFDEALTLPYKERMPDKQTLNSIYSSIGCNTDCTYSAFYLCPDRKTKIGVTGIPCTCSVTFSNGCISIDCAEGCPSKEWCGCGGNVVR